MMTTHRVFGAVKSSGRQDTIVDVGLFSSARIQSEPIIWERTTDGQFSLMVSEGTYFLHAISGVLHSTDFFESKEWGSYGGLYGFGMPLSVTHDIGPIQVIVSAIGRDLLHIPHHRQISVSEIQAEWVRQVEHLLLRDPSLTIANLADRLTINRVYLAATFKRARGLTIEEFRSCVRIEAAKALLIRSNEPLITIADMVGYESLSQLSRVFQELTGVTPGRFRDFARQLNRQDEVKLNGMVHGGTPHRFRPVDILDRLTATISGKVQYEGSRRGKVIYVGVFRTQSPSSYPLAWTSIPRPGRFTIRCMFTGPAYLMACYCEKQMRYPGDMRTAFADGVYGQVKPLRYGEQSDAPVLNLGRGESFENLVVHLFDNDTAARHSSPWTNVFLPDGH